MPDVQYKHPRYSRRIQSKSDPPYGDLELAQPLPVEFTVSNRRVSAPHANRTSLPKLKAGPQPDTPSRAGSSALPEVKEITESKAQTQETEHINDENEPPSHVGDGKATEALSKSRGSRRGRGWLRGRRGRGPSGSLRAPSTTVGTN